MPKTTKTGSSTSSRKKSASKSNRSVKKTIAIIKNRNDYNLSQNLEKELSLVISKNKEPDRGVYSIFVDIFELAKRKKLSRKLKEQIVKIISLGPEEIGDWWEITEGMSDLDIHFEKELVEPHLDDIKKIIQNENDWTSDYEIPNSLETLLNLTNDFELSNKKVGEIYIVSLEVLYASGEAMSALDTVRRSLIKQISKLSD